MPDQPIRDYLNSKGTLPLPDQLPLVHTSRCEWALSFAGTPELQPRPCPVYGEDLLYLFYGRPAYRPRTTGVHAIAYCPICFILKLNRHALVLNRVMPVDSGGVSENRFHPYVDSAQRDLLELDTSVEAAQKLVQVFYKDNREYLLGNCQPLSSFADVSDDLVRQYITMLNDRDVSRADDRRSAIEFQVAGKVSLQHDLQAVVLPESLLDDYSLRRTILEEWNALPITYPVFAATSTSEYAPVIRDKVMAFYSKYHFI